VLSSEGDMMRTVKPGSIAGVAAGGEAAVDAVVPKYSRGIVMVFYSL
jgi:hypothetical protein